MQMVTVVAKIQTIANVFALMMQMGIVNASVVAVI
jgi:hypothetical protein